MARIRNANPKSGSGGYERLIGDKDLAKIFTLAQSTVISNGTELEKLISEKALLVDNLNDFISNCSNGKQQEGTYLCTKKVLKQSSYKLDKHEPDFLIFKIKEELTCDFCYVLELKDGDMFDTKKSLAEKEVLQLFVSHISPQIPFKTEMKICCFNQDDKAKIIQGFKNVFSDNEVMTGRELCSILGIKYDDILLLRDTDKKDNFSFVIEKLVEIQDVKDKVVENQRKYILDEDFYKVEDES